MRQLLHMRKKSLTIAEVMLQKLYMGLPTLILAAQQLHHAVDPPDANGKSLLLLYAYAQRKSQSVHFLGGRGSPTPYPPRTIRGSE